MHLKSFYTVQRTFADGDVASAGDNTECLDRAYDMYAEALEDGCLARVFFLEFEPGTGLLERTTEVTPDMAAQFEQICRDRGLIAAE